MTSVLYNKLRKIAEGGRRPMLPYPGIDFDQPVGRKRYESVHRPVPITDVTRRVYESDYQPQRAQKPPTTQQLDESDNPMYWWGELRPLNAPKQVQQSIKKSRPRGVEQIYLPDSNELPPNKPKQVKKFTIPKPGEAPDWYREGE